MGLENDYLKAVLPHQARVLGQRLRPLTLGHVMVLTRHDSPFISGSSQPQFGDLCFAVWVCKRNWKQLLVGMGDSSFSRDVRFLKWMGRFRNRNNAILVFIQYLTLATKSPELFFSKVEGSKPTTMNNLHYMKIVMMSKLNKTHEAAMDTPFGEAIYDAAALGEGEGSCNFVTDGQRDIVGVVKGLEEKRKIKVNGEQQRN